MPNYYLRVDAVNLSNFVYDTHDISTIRGGSYLLQDAIASITESSMGGKLKPISTAASQGIFYFTAADIQEAEKIKIETLNHVRAKTEHHATFVAAIQEELQNDFSKTLALLEAKVRRAQWQNPTMVVPRHDVHSPSACFLDGWRPGVKRYQVDPNITDKYISAATSMRRELGREIKHKIFSEIIKEDKYFEDISVRDLGELASAPQKGNPNLIGKIAYIHIDGNSFGKIRNELCKSKEDRQKFDEVYQGGFRNKFLKALVDYAKERDDFQVTLKNGKKALRLEILVWGGDEITLVVPAWYAWQVVDMYFAYSKELDFNKTRLTHRAAVVFCHHNTPILLIKKIAEDILGIVKSNIPNDASDSASNALHCLVLESMDMLQGDMDSFVLQHYKGADYNKLLIQSAEITNLVEAVKMIKKHISHNTVFKIIEALQSSDLSAIKSITKSALQSLGESEKVQLNSLILNLTRSDTQPGRWYLVSDLWDYITESI